MFGVKKKILSFLLVMWSLMFFIVPVHAQSLTDEITGQYNKSAQKAEIGAVDPRLAIAGIIKYMLTALGTIFMVLIVISGYWLLTARGEEDKVEKATKTIRAAIIGLVITLAAYSITLLVGNFTQQAITGQVEEPDRGGKWSDYNND